MDNHMLNLKNFFAPCLLALALCSSSAAHAGPSYHVSVNTGAYNGQGLMDFTFLANAGVTPATAVLSNFSGAFGAEFDRTLGVVGAISGMVTLDNQNGGTYLTQFVTLGGLFGFDVRFDGDFANINNLNATQFNATLYNSTLSQFLGVEGSFAAFDLLPPANGQPGTVLTSAPNALATASPIPEPSSLMLALAALALLGLVRDVRAGAFSIKNGKTAM